MPAFTNVFSQDLGPIKEEEDCLSDRALELGIRRYVKAAEGNMEFSMVALATNVHEEAIVNGH